MWAPNGVAGSTSQWADPRRSFQVRQQAGDLLYFPSFAMHYADAIAVGTMAARWPVRSTCSGQQ